jgi:hypothetical protein
MDEGLVIQHDGRLVGVAVRVRGGFMFFSSDPDLRALEAKVFRRLEMVSRLVAETVRKSRSSRQGDAAALSDHGISLGEVEGGKIVRLRASACVTKARVGPPGAA